MVYIRNINDIYRRIRDVHTLHVDLAGAVGQNVHFARAKREPCDSSTASAKCHGHAKARAANKNHQSRRVHGPHNHRTRNPAPASAEFSPATVMEWSKAPGFVFNPGPTPRCDPGPVAIAIRRPTGID